MRFQFSIKLRSGRAGTCAALMGKAPALAKLTRPEIVSAWDPAAHYDDKVGITLSEDVVGQV